MAIDPRVLQAAGDVPQVYSAVSDLDRRVRQLEATRSVIGAGTISGGTGGMISTTPGSQVIAANIQAGAIDASLISAGAITAGAISVSSLSAISANMGTITAGSITATATIHGDAITANTVQANRLSVSTLSSITANVGTLTAGTLTSGVSITGQSLVTGSVDANKLNVVTLSAITANMGTITAGTITGALFQSSASNPRASVDSTGFKLTNTAGTLTFHADAATGKIITLAGIGGFNRIENARFDSWPASPGDVPYLWAKYDNGGTGGPFTWSKVAAGGPNGVNSWRVQVTSKTANKGFRTLNQIKMEPSSVHVLSFDWKGDQLPNVTGNWGATMTTTTISAPAVSATAWQRYSYRLTRDATTGAAGGDDADQVYIHSNATSYDVQIANVQLEQGDIPTAFSTKADEILPSTISGGSVGANSPIVPDTIIGTDLVTDTITTREMFVATLSALSANLGTITAGTINSTVSINGNAIQAATVDATKLSVTTLSAITANMGTLTAGTIEGATIRSGPTSGARVQLVSTGVSAFADATTETFRLNSADGTVSQKGYLISELSGTTIFADADTHNFENDIGGWAGTNGSSIVRSTAQFKSGTASGLITTIYAADQGARAIATASGYTFLAGREYLATLWVRKTTGTSLSTGWMDMGDWFNAQSAGAASGPTYDIPLGVWVQLAVRWIPSANFVTSSAHNLSNGVRVELNLPPGGSGAGATWHIDDLKIFDITPPAVNQFAIRDTVPSGTLIGALSGSRWDNNAVVKLTANAAALTSFSEISSQVVSAGIALSGVTARYTPASDTGKASVVLALQPDAGGQPMESLLLDSAGRSEFGFLEEDRTAFPFAANWSDYGSGYEVGSYSKMGRLVILQGLIKKSSAPANGNLIGTLPEGCRPYEILQFVVKTGGVTDQYGQIEIQPDGDVVWQKGDTNATNNTSLSGVSFIAAPV
jgi:hypothetical protein